MKHHPRRHARNRGRGLAVALLASVLALASTVVAPPVLAAPPPAKSKVDHGNHTHGMKPHGGTAGSGNESPDGNFTGVPGTDDLTYHGGPVMRDVTNYLIFWNPPGSTFAANYRSTLEQYFLDDSATPWMQINSEYGDSTGAPVPNTNHFGASWVDTTNAYPSAGTVAAPVTRADVQAEIDRAITAHPAWQAPGLSTMYFVFLGENIIECKGGNTDCFAGPGVSNANGKYCAYHSYFGDKVFATMPYAASSTRCGSNTAYPNGQDVDVEISPTSHEQFEAYSDPHLDAWYNDATGNENGDNCSYTYGQIEPDGTNLVLNGHRYQSQIEWSNGAGCIKRAGARSTPAISGDLTFGVVPRGTTATRDLSVANTGSGDLNLLDVRLAAGAPTGLSLSPAAPRATTLRPGQSTLLHVSYAPSSTATTAGDFTSSVVVDTDQPGVETQSLPVTGSTGLPHLVVTGSLDFGTVPRGTSASRQIGIQNLGKGDLNVSDIAVSGDPAYSVSPSSPTSGSLPPGGFLTASVTFAPAGASGPAAPSGMLTITSDDVSTPTVTVPASAVVGVPKAVVTPAAVDLSVVCPDTTTTKAFTVTNTGTAPLTITSIAPTAGSSPYLSVPSTPALPQTLPPGGHLDFSIALAVPTGTPGGPVAGSVDVTTDDPVTPVTNLPVTGTLGSATLSLSTTALAFGGVAVDDRTAPATRDRNLTLSNTGTCVLTLPAASLALGGANPDDFSLAGAPALPLTIAPGSSVSLTLRFDPSIGGPRSASLTITPAAPTPATSVALTGTGLLPALLTSPASITYGPTVLPAQAPGYPGATVGEVLTNVGQTEFIADVQTTSVGPFSATAPSSPPARFAASDHWTVPVLFAPTTTGRFNGTLTVSDTGAGVGPVSTTVPLCGEGVRRGIRVLAVDAAGAPFASVARLKLVAQGTATKVNVNASNLGLTPVATSCDATAKMQYENQALPSTSTVNQRSSYYTLSVTAGGKSTTVTFTLGIAEFKTLVVTIK